MATKANLERARRGAAWLDAKLPGWRRKIRRRKLDMEMGYMEPGDCGCVLAQLDFKRGKPLPGGHSDPVGSYSRLAEELDLRSPVKLGFIAGFGYTYDDLTEAWREVLRGT